MAKIRQRHKIRMLKDIPPLKKGEIIEVTKATAMGLLEDGSAGYIQEATTKLKQTFINKEILDRIE